MKPLYKNSASAKPPIDWPRLSLNSGLCLVLLQLACTLVINLVVFRYKLLTPIINWSGGWLSATFLASFSLLIGFAVLLKWYFDYPIGRLGLAWRQLPSAGLASLSFYLLAQGSAWLTPNLWQWPGLSDLPSWRALITDLVLSQWLGNALFEEIFWRQVLFTQCVGSAMRACKQPAYAIGLGLVMSQGLFALSHLPNRLLSWDALALNALYWDQLWLFGAGCYFCLLYWITGNLSLVVGIHGLLNASPNIVSPTYPLLVVAITTLSTWCLRYKLANHQTVHLHCLSMVK